MFSRIRIASGIALLMSLVLVIPALAGGWAVITLDELPTDVTAGESLTVGFTVLQHGKTPMTGLDPTVTIESNKERVVVFAEEQGKPGHYVADIMFPSEGTWNWSIQAFTMDQPMPSLSVAPPKAATAKTEPSTTGGVQGFSFIPVLTMGIGLAGLAVAIVRRNRMAMTLTALCLLVGAALALGDTRASAAESGQSQSAASAEMSQVEYGRQLFLAKGCITCHYNTKAASPNDYWTIEFTGATNLSNFSASPEVLRIRLKDPSAAKSDTQMPNLELKEWEIEALIAFINSK